MTNCNIEIYHGYTISIDSPGLSAFYTISCGVFVVHYGPFIGPNSAMESAKILVDILVENISL